MEFWRTPLNVADVSVPRGKVNVIDDRCKGCGYCVEYCPKGILELSDRFNVKGYHPPTVTDPEQCVDCKLCEMLCPEFAVWVVSQGEVAIES